MSSTHASRILMIDDDEATLIVVRKLLEATGVFVDVSLSANDALVRLSEQGRRKHEFSERQRSKG